MSPSPSGFLGRPAVPPEWVPLWKGMYTTG